MARIGLITSVVLLGLCGTPAAAQLGGFSENQPGRVYYDCRANINGADMWTAFGEDGGVLGYDIKANAMVSALVVPNTLDGTDKMPHVSVELNWPPEMSTDRFKRKIDPNFNAGDVSVTVHYLAKDEMLLDRKQYPWSQYLITNENDVTFFQDGTDRSLYLSGGGPFLMTEITRMDAAYQLYSPLSILNRWANADGDVTVYKLYKKRRKPEKGERDALPFGYPWRIVYSYRLDVDELNAWAAQTAQDFVTWQGGLTDFKTRCTRQVEEDEGQIIV